jgi:hypothetical protein
MAVVATVNGQGVPVRELELFLAQERAPTFAYFQQHFGDGDSVGFWTTSHGGQTPRDYLEKLALADVTRATVQQDLELTYGLLADPGYASFLRAWQAENARRALAISRHQVIYGPVQYTEADYFSYVFGQLADSLQTKLVQKGVITVATSALRRYYLAHPAEYQQSANGKGQDTTVIGPVAPPAAAPFGKVKAQVQQDYVQERYNALVTRLAGAASVHVNPSILAAVQVS